MKKKETEINFEEAMKKLDGIVEKLERGNIPLEEALKQFDSGIQLVRLLNKKLDDAERKIEMLLKDKDGNLVKKEMEFENGELREKVGNSQKFNIQSPELEKEKDDDNDEGNGTPSLF